MKFSIIFFFSSTLFLFGCSDTIEKEIVEGQPIAQIETESTPTEQDEVSAPVEEVNNTLTRADVDSLFTVDPEVTQYENGQLKFKHGEIVEVDYILYLGSDGIDYASALFIEDKLLQLQLDTTLSDEKLEKILGIDINGDLMVNDKRDRGVLEITFNGKFRESTIAKYPFEM